MSGSGQPISLRAKPVRFVLRNSRLDCPLHTNYSRDSGNLRKIGQKIIFYASNRCGGTKLYLRPFLAKSLKSSARQWSITIIKNGGLET